MSFMNIVWGITLFFLVLFQHDYGHVSFVTFVFREERGHWSIGLLMRSYWSIFFSVRWLNQLRWFR